MKKYNVTLVENPSIFMVTTTDSYRFISVGSIDHISDCLGLEKSVNVPDLKHNAKKKFKDARYISQKEFEALRKRVQDSSLGDKLIIL